MHGCCWSLLVETCLRDARNHSRPGPTHGHVWNVIQVQPPRSMKSWNLCMDQSYKIARLRRFKNIMIFNIGM